MGSAETRRCAGVALFRKSQEVDLAVFEWAYKHLRLSKKYKLWIIHVDELNNRNQPQQSPDPQYGFDQNMETKFQKNYPGCDYGTIQSSIQGLGIQEYICGVTYEGENSEATLQCAINRLQKDEGLDTLVLGWSAADHTKRTPINKLVLNGCSIVLANVDSRKMTFSMPPTQGSAATAATPPMASAPTNQYDKTNSSGSSNPRTRRPNRETDTGTLAAVPTAPTEGPTATAVATASTKGTNKSRSTPKVLNKQAQSSSLVSETDTQRSGGQVPRTPNKRSEPAAEPSTREKTTPI